MKFFSANKIYTGKEVLQQKVVVVGNENEILNIIDRDSIDISKVQILDGVICPGFVNSHCHLELSHFYGKLQEGKGLDTFISQIESLKREMPRTLEESIFNADSQMYLNGIVLVGDICNTSDTFKIKEHSKIKYHNFIEVFAFHPSKANEVFEKGLKLLNVSPKPVSITPHAPYSASIELFKLISKFALEQSSILTIHNQESEDENNMFLKKSGKIMDRLKSFRIETDFWIEPEENSLPYILKYIPNQLKMQLVHNTFTTNEDIVHSNGINKNLFWCFCPNANLYIENKMPDISLFVKNNCKITIGTDSLASNHSLNILDEWKTILKKYPQILLEQLVEWSTINGAEFLGFSNSIGSIEIGKAPGLNLISSIENNNITHKSIVQKII